MTGRTDESSAPPATYVPRRPDRRSVAVLVAATLLGLAAATYLVVAGTTLGSHLFVEDLWFFENSEALSPEEMGKTAAKTWNAVVLAVWAAAWLLLLVAVRRGVAARWLFLVGSLWSVPLLVGPPLFSGDAYFYTAIGAAVRSGIDPYENGPGVVEDPWVVRGAEEFWRFEPTPYSPPFVFLLSGLSRVFEVDLLSVFVALRVLSVAAWLLAAVVLVKIARHYGFAANRAVWLGVINPLVLLHIVSAAHNDALMVALVLPGLLLALRGRPLLGVLLCVAAAGVKVIALVAVFVIGVDYARRQTGWPARLRALALAGAVGAGAFALSVQLSGFGWGWLDNLEVPGKALEPLTPTTALAVTIDLQDPPLDGLRLAALVVGAVATLLLTLLLGRWGPVRVTGWAFVVVIVTGSVVWPWYFLWPTMIFAAAGTRAERTMVAVWSVLMLFTTQPGGQSVLALFSRPGVDRFVLGVYAVVLVGGIAWALRRRQWRARQDPAGVH
ncbi:polyprenol phosphomannose-dependent alpha 1,6 mannosyltransferase MptB [Candidatus Blastococcus massiliensis]|uniref:polyprenol phosphomannose-dependent alpha 1,6 mannosyltransferase MptB n=1 Tax=Candidatus Blastococcus massiliensis TaxID=1470358 RepID=UPI0004AF01E5|nr:polyprenol phosphomannose-dependent alpha 1,6 mannosyltransferase MptB [Candidatus Blastococcus massiliensis]